MVRYLMGRKSTFLINAQNHIPHIRNNIILRKSLVGLKNIIVLGLWVPPLDANLGGSISVGSIFHIFTLLYCMYCAINGLAARESPVSTPLVGSVDSSRINTRSAACTRLAYILLCRRIYIYIY